MCRSKNDRLLGRVKEHDNGKPQESSKRCRVINYRPTRLLLGRVPFSSSPGFRFRFESEVMLAATEFVVFSSTSKVPGDWTLEGRETPCGKSMFATSLHWSKSWRMSSRTRVGITGSSQPPISSRLMRRIAIQTTSGPQLELSDCCGQGDLKTSNP